MIASASRLRVEKPGERGGLINMNQEIELITAEDKISGDELYLKVWEADQRHTTTRWTVSTFFLSVSFAIFGLSFQIEKFVVPRIVPQLGAVAIYWFTYMLFLRFNTYTRFLRGYLAKMESDNRTKLDIQSKATSYLNENKSATSTELLLYFGIGYTVVCLIVGILF